MNLREFGDWALNQRSVANPPPNNGYKGQCVSLVQQMLYQVLGIPFKAHGNAKDWEYNVPAGFTKLPAGTPLQRGDILVYGANYGGGYGHIGFIDANFKFFDQNGINRLAVGYRDQPFGGYRCILRYNKGFDCGDTVVNTSSQYEPGSYQVTAPQGVNVRAGAGTNFEKTAKAIPCGSKQGIDRTQGNWGHLMNNVGWICLDYCKRI